LCIPNKGLRDHKPVLEVTLLVYTCGPGLQDDLAGLLTWADASDKAGCIVVVQRGQAVFDLVILVVNNNTNNNDYTFPVRRLGVFRDDLMITR
jgi:hypothetical protein